MDVTASAPCAIFGEEICALASTGANARQDIALEPLADLKHAAPLGLIANPA